MKRKYISLEEAQKLIPEVRRRLLKIMKLNKAIEVLSEIEISYYDDFEDISNEVSFNKKFHQLCFKLFSELQTLTKKGAALEDIDRGAINFYAVHKNRPVILCWQIGDKRIKYWKGMDEDFSERKPLSRLG